MSITTYEGVVEKGKIRLKSDVKLPENVVVYVIVLEVQTQKKRQRGFAPHALFIPGRRFHNEGWQSIIHAQIRY